MSNLAKKIRKTVSKSKNAVCIELDEGLLPELVAEFTNVFFCSENSPSFKSKNLIFLESIDVKFQIPEVSTIIVNDRGLQKLLSINYILESQQPDIALISNEGISEQARKYLGNVNYNIVLLEKRWQLWRKKGKTL